MGRLIWLMGPSGSGKTACCPPYGSRSIRSCWWRTVTLPGRRMRGVKPYRPERAGVFTRAGQNSAGAELARQRLLLWIGIETDLWLHAGFDVLVNGSRAHLSQARARYGAALLPVCLQVSPDVLRSRLQSRGRESAREIDQRLARAARYTPSDCHILNNDGSLLQSVETFLSLIRQKEKQHA